MIAIRKDMNIDIREVIRRSPVAAVEGAQDIMNECMFRSVEVRYGLLDNEVACMWGLIPPTLLSDAAYIWLLTTDIVAENKFLFIRHSQRWVESALETYPRLIGDCMVGNDQAVRWLKWLGAEFDQPIAKRIPFTIRKKNG